MQRLEKMCMAQKNGIAKQTGNDQNFTTALFNRRGMDDDVLRTGATHDAPDKG
jgi:hypothetical protein